jgi:hypothetical protein
MVKRDYDPTDKFCIQDVRPEDVYTPICFTCKYWSGKDGGDRFTCTAYPKGIPIGIITGKWDHHANLPGDGGIHWEPVST